MEQEAGQNSSCSSPTFLQAASTFSCMPQGPLPTTLLHPTSPVCTPRVMSSPTHHPAVTAQPLPPDSSPTLAAKVTSKPSREDIRPLLLSKKKVVEERVRGGWRDIVATSCPHLCPRRDLGQLTAPHEGPLPCAGFCAALCVTTLRPALL